MIATILVFLGLVFSNPSEGVETYTVKVDESTVSWKGSKVGGSHNGTIGIKEGGLDLEENVVKGGTFVIDMTSLSNDDLSGEYKQKLEGHLKSDDFFGVATFPTATFVITEAVAGDNNDYEITGDITIKGITQTITFPAKIEANDDGVVANADIVVDRSKFDVRYGSDSFFDNLGDKVIYDDFNLTVSLVASK